ncbi:glycoside hydrolase family 13 protein [Hoeflea sp.]|uniref:glycoside hydrolase family 13 protein n=1 Tax=Hoeflea sp. TaxID=1940281 RepID=UPI003B01013E
MGTSASASPSGVSEATPPWWQTCTGYQVWPKSFADSNGDGLGDLPGIISKLDHLEELGVGLMWLSPVCASPMVDDGYDISDYRTINPCFGTLDDMDRLISEARDRGIRVIMDLVVNHTSDRHAWFRTALADPGSPEHDYYIWRDPKPDGRPPSDMKASFGGPAWVWVPELGKYYFAYFSPNQPDLNWTNPKVRREIYDMMNWWLDRGIAGFRMDVISLIGKDVDAEIYEEGPLLHTHLQEMHRETLAGRDCVTVGESWAVSPQTALDYVGRERHELNMVFQFNHVTAFHDEQHGKWLPMPFDVVTFKKVMFTWQKTMAKDGWNALFLSNHDLPRAVSAYGETATYRIRSAKMLATVLHLLRGTPFIYQGEEIGMTNAGFSCIDEFRDIETLRQMEELSKAGMDPDEFMAGAFRNSRDNARTPMQWSAAQHAAFSTVQPWIDVNPNHATINVEMDRQNPEGICHHYKRLVGLRKDLPIVSHGRFVSMAEDDTRVMAFSRELNGERLAVLANFKSERVVFEVPKALEVTGKTLVCNVAERPDIRGQLELEPFEAIAVLGPIA